MSQLGSSSSNQLLAAAIAFHRVRQKFSENSLVFDSEPSNYQKKDFKNNRVGSWSMKIAKSRATDNNAPPRQKTMACGCRCQQNCKSAGDKNSLDGDKSNNRRCDDGAVGDSIAVGVSMLENASDGVKGATAWNKNFKEFKDVKDLLCSETYWMNNTKCHRRSLERKMDMKTLSHGDSIDLIYDSIYVHSADTRNEDGVLEQHKYKHPSCDVSLMKMQRFLANDKMFPLPIQTFNSSACQSPNCQRARHHSYGYDSSSNSENASTLDTHSQSEYYSRHPKKLRHRVQRKCCVENKKKDLSLGAFHTHCNDTNETEDEEFIKGMSLIKHKDSLDILVEKFKNRKFLDKLKDTRLCEIESGSMNGCHARKPGVNRHQIKQQTEYWPCKNHDGRSETCCTRKYSCSRDDKCDELNDRFKQINHTMRRS